MPSTPVYNRSQWSNLSIQERIRAMNQTLDDVEAQPSSSTLGGVTMTESGDQTVSTTSITSHDAPSSSNDHYHQPAANQCNTNTKSHSHGQEEEDDYRRSSVIDIWRRKDGSAQGKVVVSDKTMKTTKTLPTQSNSTKPIRAVVAFPTDIMGSDDGFQPTPHAVIRIPQQKQQQQSSQEKTAGNDQGREDEPNENVTPQSRTSMRDVWKQRAGLTKSTNSNHIVMNNNSNNHGDNPSNNFKNETRNGWNAVAAQGTTTTTTTTTVTTLPPPPTSTTAISSVKWTNQARRPSPITTETDLTIIPSPLADENPSKRLTASSPQQKLLEAQSSLRNLQFEQQQQQQVPESLTAQTTDGSAIEAEDATPKKRGSVLDFWKSRSSPRGEKNNSDNSNNNNTTIIKDPPPKRASMPTGATPPTNAFTSASSASSSVSSTNRWKQLQEKIASESTTSLASSSASTIDNGSVSEPLETNSELEPNPWKGSGASSLRRQYSDSFLMDTRQDLTPTTNNRSKPISGQGNRFGRPPATSDSCTIGGMKNNSRQGWLDGGTPLSRATATAPSSLQSRSTGRAVVAVPPDFNQAGGQQQQRNPQLFTLNRTDQSSVGGDGDDEEDDSLSTRQGTIKYGKPPLPNESQESSNKSFSDDSYRGLVQTPERKNPAWLRSTASNTSSSPQANSNRSKWGQSDKKEEQGIHSGHQPGNRWNRSAGDKTVAEDKHPPIIKSSNGLTNKWKVAQDEGKGNSSISSSTDDWRKRQTGELNMEATSNSIERHRMQSTSNNHLQISQAVPGVVKTWKQKQEYHNGNTRVEVSKTDQSKKVELIGERIDQRQASDDRSQSSSLETDGNSHRQAQSYRGNGYVENHIQHLDNNTRFQSPVRSTDGGLSRVGSTPTKAHGVNMNKGGNPWNQRGLLHPQANGNHTGPAKGISELNRIRPEAVSRNLESETTDTSSSQDADAAVDASPNKAVVSSPSSVRKMWTQRVESQSQLGSPSPQQWRNERQRDTSSDTSRNRVVPAIHPKGVEPQKYGRIQESPVRSMRSSSPVPASPALLNRNKTLNAQDTRSDRCQDSPMRSFRSSPLPLSPYRSCISFPSPGGSRQPSNDVSFFGRDTNAGEPGSKLLSINGAGSFSGEAQSAGVMKDSQAESRMKPKSHVRSPSDGELIPLPPKKNSSNVNCVHDGVMTSISAESRQQSESSQDRSLVGEVAVRPYRPPSSPIRNDNRSDGKPESLNTTLTTGSSSLLLGQFPTRIIHSWSSDDATKHKPVNPNVPKPAASAKKNVPTSLSVFKPLGSRISASESSAFNAYETPAGTLAESSSIDSARNHRKKRNLVKLGRRHIVKGLAHKLSNSSPSPSVDDESIKTGDQSSTVGSDATSTRCSGHSNDADVRDIVATERAVYSDGVNASSDKQQIIKHDYTKVKTGRAPSRDYESDATPKRGTSSKRFTSPRTVKSKNTSFAEKSEQLPRNRGNGFLEKSKPKPSTQSNSRTSDVPALELVISHSISVDSGCLHNLESPADSILKKKKQLQAKRKRAKDFKNSDNDNEKKSTAKDYADCSPDVQPQEELYHELLDVDDDDNAMTTYGQNKNVSEYTTFQAPKFKENRSSTGEKRVSTKVIESPRSDGGKSEVSGNFSDFSGISRNPSNVSATSSLASRAEKRLQERRRRGNPLPATPEEKQRANKLARKVLSRTETDASMELKRKSKDLAAPPVSVDRISFPRQCDYEHRQYGVSNHEASYLKSTEGQANGRAMVRSGEDQYGVSNSTLMAEKKRRELGMSTRYNTSSRFMDNDNSHQATTHVEEANSADESASSSYRTIETSSTGSDTRSNETGRTSERGRSRNKRDRLQKGRRSLSVGAIPEQFVDESAENMQTFKRAFETFGFQQLAVDLANEVSNATLDITLMAKGMNEKVQSLRGNPRNAMALTCKSLVPKCDNYVEEDVAIEVEFLDDSHSEDDPARDLPHCGLIDEAVVDEEDMVRHWVSVDEKESQGTRSDGTDQHNSTQSPAGQPSFEEPHTQPNYAPSSVRYYDYV